MRPTLSPRDLAHAIGVSESSVKRWADVGLLHAARTAGGHRRIPRTEAIRFIREQQLPVEDPVMLGMPEIAAAGREGLGSPDLVPTRFFNALRTGDSPAARGLVLGAYLQGMSVAELCDRVIAPAMHRLGELWEHSPEGIYLEHRGTDICIQALNQLRLALPEPDESALTAVGAAPEGDIYLLPTLAAAVLLAAEGFNSVNLGPQTPLHSLRAAVKEYRPRLVWMSLSIPPVDPAEFTASLEEFDAELAASGISFVIGGRCTRTVRLPPSLRGFVCSSMTELAAFVRGVVDAEPRKVV